MSARAHFKIAGIPVRVEPVFFVIAALFGLRYIDIGVEIVLIWVATTFVSILVHEMGHGIALKVFGQPSAIVLHGFGGVTVSPRRRGPGGLSRARSIFVSLAGSLFALALLWLPMRTLWGSDWIFDQSRYVVYAIYFLQFQNLWWSVANLLPIRPLDGGNVTAELFGLDSARRISIGVAIAGALYCFVNDQTYAAFFALFLAFSNYQEIRAEQTGGAADAFHVEPPDPGGAAGKRRRGTGNLRAVPTPSAAEAGPGPGLASPDAARMEQQAWGALRSGDTSTAARLVAGAGAGSVSPFLRASTALVTGDPKAFELFEAAYVANPSGPPNLVATDLLARSGAALAVAKRLVARSDGKGREGAANLQTHLHYGERFAVAAEVGEAVFAARPASPAQTAFEIACSWARAGDVDRAARWLDQAADAGFRAASIVDGEPDLAAVREHPTWPVLRARLI